MVLTKIVASLTGGTVAERTNASALKAEGSQGPGVRIPPVPLKCCERSCSGPPVGFTRYTLERCQSTVEWDVLLRR